MVMQAWDRCACCLIGVLVLACTADAPRANTDATDAGGSPDGTAGQPGTGVCVGPRVVTAKRVVRLSEHQLFTAYASLFGAAAAAVIARNEESPSLLDREFPPITGDVGVSQTLLGKIDRLAQAAMTYVVQNAGTLTACGAVPSDKACVQEYLLSFAERAFRHPLSDDEQVALTGQFWTDMTAAGASLAEALGYGVYGVLSAPGFVYRTEFGADVAAEGPLTPHEIATALALFLTDAPPDGPLLAAADTNQLATPEQLRVQAARLLATPEARVNLEAALVKYFALTNAPTAILNAEVTPGLAVTAGLQSSIFHEGELFMKSVLWSGPLGNLLTSRQTWTNAAIATQVYGVPGPNQVDSNGFGPVDLPDDRAGLLTLSTFLLAGARSTGGSPVTRGLAVNRSVICEVNPSFPQVLDPTTGQSQPDPDVTSAIAALADKSEREKAAVRAATPKCAGCHAHFDAFGMVLEPYDAVGRRRSTDLEGRPIDGSWTTVALPRSVGGATVTGAAAVAAALVASGALDRCLAMNFINYALGDTSRGGANNTELGRAPQTGSCAVASVLDRFARTDRSFTSLMQEIAVSDALIIRTRGQ